jgi:hypothetical protein
LIERIPGNIPGAYVSLESEIIRYIKYHVNPETDKIKIEISGDRSKVSRISLNLSKINNKSLIFCLSSSGKSWYEDLLDDRLKSTLTVCSKKPKSVKST